MEIHRQRDTVRGSRGVPDIAGVNAVGVFRGGAWHLSHGNKEVFGLGGALKVGLIHC